MNDATCIVLLRAIQKISNLASLSGDTVAELAASFGQLFVFRRVGRSVCSVADCWLAAWLAGWVAGWASGWHGLGLRGGRKGGRERQHLACWLPVAGGRLHTYKWAPGCMLAWQHRSMPAGPTSR